MNIWLPGVCTAWSSDCWPVSPWATGVYSTAFLRSAAIWLCLLNYDASGADWLAAPTPVRLWERQTAGSSSVYQLLQVKLSPRFVQSPKITCCLWKSKCMRCLCCSAEGQRWKLISLQTSFIAEQRCLVHLLVYSVFLSFLFFPLSSLNPRLSLSRKFKLFVSFKLLE